MTSHRSNHLAGDSGSIRLPPLLNLDDNSPSSFQRQCRRSSGEQQASSSPINVTDEHSVASGQLPVANGGLISPRRHGGHGEIGGVWSFGGMQLVRGGTKRGKGADSSTIPCRCPAPGLSFLLRSPSAEESVTKRCRRSATRMKYPSEPSVSPSASRWARLWRVSGTRISLSLFQRIGRA